MIVYHGSLDIIEEPRILMPTRTLDYGCGFYTTTSEQQAEEWVKRKFQGSTNKGYVNVYEIDDQSLTKLKVLRFPTPSDEWIDFVMSNRQNEDYQHDNDIVYGPVANDRVYVQFSLYEQGFISKQTLLQELKVYKLVDQLLFHTEKSLNILRFKEAKEVRS